MKLTLENFNVDWELLRKQKSWLYEMKTEEADGLINFLDYIMDAAVDSGTFTEEEVFAFEEEEKIQYILQSSHGVVEINELGYIIVFEKDLPDDHCYIDDIHSFDVCDYEERMMYMDRDLDDYKFPFDVDILHFGYNDKEGWYHPAQEIKSMRIIYLDSIGCGFDLERRRIIPAIQVEHGITYHWSNWSHVSEIDDPGAWEEISKDGVWEEISKEDYKKIILTLVN